MQLNFHVTRRPWISSRSFLRRLNQTRANSSNASRLVKVDNIPPGALQVLPRLLLPYEPIDGIKVIGDSTYIRFIDPRVAACFIKEVEAGFLLPGGSRAESMEYAQESEISFAGLWRGESRSVKWTFSPETSDEDIRRKVMFEEGFMGVERLSEGPGRTLRVTFSDMEAAAQALSVECLPGETIQPIPFRIGLVQDTVSSYIPQYKKTGNVLHLGNFLPKRGPFLELGKLATNLSITSSHLDENNTLQLSFATSRQAFMFRGRVLQSPILMSAFDRQIQRLTGPAIPRHQWLAINLGISPSIYISLPPADQRRRASRIDPKARAYQLIKDFTPFGIVHQATVHNDIGYVHFLDIDSAATAIAAINRGDVKGYEHLPACFVTRSNTSHMSLTKLDDADSIEE